jgi:CheY-like chemotaxis protein
MPERHLQVVLAEKRTGETTGMVESICATAGWELKVISPQNKEDLVQLLRGECSDVALLELSLLQPGAAAFLGVLQSNIPAFPIIIFAETADMECIGECLAVGASNFLLKGSDKGTIARMLRYTVTEWQDERPVSVRSGTTAQAAAYLGVELAGGAKNIENGSDPAILGSVVKDLKRAVRASDEIVCTDGAILLRLADVNERCTQGIRDRIQARLRTLPGTLRFQVSAVIHDRPEGVWSDESGFSALSPLSKSEDEQARIGVEER